MGVWSFSYLGYKRKVPKALLSDFIQSELSRLYRHLFISLNTEFKVASFTLAEIPHPSAFWNTNFLQNKILLHELIAVTYWPRQLFEYVKEVGASGFPNKYQIQVEDANKRKW